MSLPIAPNCKDDLRKPTMITILRHGESLHNIDRTHSTPDPPLTSKGLQDASQVTITLTPDLILISPMTRTIQTAIAVFGDKIMAPEATIEVQIWPELREGYDHAICNQGVAGSELMAKFPFPAWDFGTCHEEWDYDSHTFDGAQLRAEEVRRKLKVLIDSGRYDHILLVSHRGFIAFLVQGERFATCEQRSYGFAKSENVEEIRYSLGVDTQLRQDFGPNILLPLHL